MSEVSIHGFPNQILIELFPKTYLFVNFIREKKSVVNIPPIIKPF